MGMEDLSNGEIELEGSYGSGEKGEVGHDEL
jgi:hypothetical protein